MNKTAIFFSPEGGNVNSVTIMLGEVIGNEKVDIIPANKVKKEDLNKYTQIIFVGSTVGADHWSNKTIIDEWQEFFRKVDEISFEDKKVAIVGLGNSVLYPEHFADGIAHLHRKIADKKAKIFGFAEAEGYTFTDSEALNKDGLFLGLPIDEDNEYDLTSERLEKWVAKLKPDFDF
jgi:flavodoxin long chain